MTAVIERDDGAIAGQLVDPQREVVRRTGEPVASISGTPLSPQRSQASDTSTSNVRCSDVIIVGHRRCWPCPGAHLWAGQPRTESVASLYG